MSRAIFLNRGTPPHSASLIAMTGLSALAMSVFLPSLPAMAQEFGVSYDTMGLSVALYLALNAVLQLFVGPLSDLYGRRRVLLIGLAIFTLASVGCAVAPTALIFLVCRMAQAFVVVAMVLSRAIVRDLYSQEQAASVLGYVTMGMAVVPMIGPGLGGLIDQAAGWRATFWMLAGLGALILAISFADVSETLKDRGKGFRAQTGDYPMLLGSTRFWGYTLAASFASGSFFAYLGGAPLIGKTIYHLSERDLGLALGAPAIGYFIGNFLSGRYAQRLGSDRLILIGSGIVTLGMLVSALMIVLGHDRALLFFGLMCSVGLGNGLLLPGAIAGMISVQPKLAGTASGLGGALQIAGGAALSAIAGQMLHVLPGALPLVLLMGGSAFLALVSTLLLRRA